MNKIANYMLFVKLCLIEKRELNRVNKSFLFIDSYFVIILLVYP